MELSSSYDRDRSRLTVHVDGRRYVYKHVSPFHNDQFWARRRNKGQAMAYIRGFVLVPACPVCAETNLDHDEICEVCGWQDDSAVDKPDKCDGGPNYAPLALIRERWNVGARDKEILGACPRDPAGSCRSCPYDAYPDIHENDQKTG